ncbi:2Fe-2S iron-sulfur cluster-binding protein [Okeania sp. SIO2B3]|uniref:2Fe-2S iron-sulfur cluster-binding protein n=1 Tax=Okeania sp. SIO2B3 TaxID=2607784 RepID=UPI0013C1136F|nr:2Fe-2S iron-sulfur cluster-binding protein [Okeania sp. SIO2B3]NET44582.1 2Fe-2S iron-sulfur cluster binding domain-containing protein [Okeania sp. SIO2B3]
MSKTYTVEIHHQGQTHTIEVPEDKKILKVAEEEYGLDLPNSCNAGVCTTCAAQILGEGTVDQADGMGVSPELQKEGYVLLCVAYPRSNLKIETGKEDEVYDRQFGASQIASK